MIASKSLEGIFKNGSKTYFNSTRFFPKDVRSDITILYGFVRTADDLVDSIPQDKEGFYQFVSLYKRAIDGEETGNYIIDSFVELSKNNGFETSWTLAFLKSMEMDLTKREYNTLDETLEYIYGSAEVIGLFMAKIMKLPQEAYTSAVSLGRSMQFINFIRDLAEDRRLGRRYFPIDGSKIEKISWDDLESNPTEFSSFINDQIQIFSKWQKEAELGYKFIPSQYLVPIKTASDMYKWTADKIKKNPLIIFKRKLKPPKALIIWTGIINKILCNMK